MIVYKPMNANAPTISKHGSTFNESEDRQQQYPFQLCPECLSEHTEVVKLPGFHRKFKHGIFMYECVRVNYICKDCGCEFYQWYDTGEKESIEVDDSIVSAIIGFIMTALSLFMLITSLSVDDPSVWVILILILSSVSSVVSGAITFTALEDIFW